MRKNYYQDFVEKNCINNIVKNDMSAFTLAEMMVVMLILSIVMAAFAPVMTTRSKVDLSSPWKWASNNSDIYYGMGANQTAMIGQKEVKDDDPKAKLIINSSDVERSRILFKNGDTVLGSLFMDDKSNTIIGDGKTIAMYNVIIGKDAHKSGTSNSAHANVAIGVQSMESNTGGAWNVAVGAAALQENVGGNGSVAVGNSALSKNTVGYNTAVGFQAMKVNTTGEKNTAVGKYALYQNTTGNNNTAMGFESLKNNVTGADNVAIGNSALTANTGSNNTAIGSSVLKANTSGGNNTAIGYSSLVANTTGGNNTAIGTEALNANTTGDNNTAIGTEALNANTTGQNNVAIGYGASQSTASQSDNNTAVGVFSLANNTEGSNNTAIGYNSLRYSGAKSSNNVAIGANASYNGGRQTVAIGTNALYNATTARGSIAIGYQALQNFAPANYHPSYNNIAIGYQAMMNAIEGTNNVALGEEALLANTYGESNIAIGYLALHSNTTGSQNIAIGNSSFSANTTSSKNIAIGSPNTGQYIGDSNIFIGQGIDVSYASTEKSNNVIIGDSARLEASDSGASSPSGGIAIGAGAKTRNAGVAIGQSAEILYGYKSDRPSSIAIGSTAQATDGGISIGYASTARNRDIIIGSNVKSTRANNNYSVIALGHDSCKNVNNDSGSVICIGNGSGPSMPTTGDNAGEHIYLGGQSEYNDRDAVVEIHNVLTTGGMEQPKKNSTAVVINGSLIVTGTIYNAVRRTSGSTVKLAALEYYEDSPAYAHWNLKVNGNPGGYNPYLDGITATDSDRRLKYVGTPNNAGLDKIRQLKVFNYVYKKDKAKTPHVGVIAQDLQKIFPDAVMKGEEGFLKIRMEDMFYALINAVKELDAKITELTNQVKILQEQNKYIIKQNKQIMQENKEIKARLKALEAVR